MAVAVNNKSMTVGQAGILKDYLQGNINAVDTKANTLIGTDTDKSARTIANEELAKQLVPESAKESLDTLSEIAAWIQKHPEDAGKMNESINANTTAIAAINNAETGIAKTAKDYADNLNTEMDTRVAELETKSASIEFASDDEFRTALSIPAPTV